MRNKPNHYNDQWFEDYYAQRDGYDLFYDPRGLGWLCCGCIKHGSNFNHAIKPAY